VTVLNTVLGVALDLLLAPFREFPIAGLAVVSLLTAAGTLLVFRATSDQRKLADAKRAMVASLLEIRLFKDDLSAVSRAQGQLLKYHARYLRLSLAPMLWLIVPVGLVVAQLDFRYGYAGLTPGEPVLVKAHLSHPVPSVTLDAPPRVHVLTPAVWFPATSEVIWRVRPEAPGEYDLNVRAEGKAFTKTFDVTERVVRRSPARISKGFFTELMNPSEEPLPRGAAVTAITVSYPSRDIRVFGREFSWMTVYFGLTIAFGIALRRPFDVIV
jgi:hypothetical protein